MTSPKKSGKKRKSKNSTRTSKKRVASHDQLMNVSDIVIMTVSLPDYTIKEYNEAMCELIGLSRTEFDGQYHDRIEEYFQGAYRKSFEVFATAVQEAIKAKKKAFTITLRIPSARGPLWVTGACSFSDVTPGKEPSSVIVIYRDVTDLILSKNKLVEAEKEAQKFSQIEEQNARMSQMINGVPSGLGALRIHEGKPSKTLQLNNYFFDRVDLKATGENGQVETEKITQCLFPKDRTAFKRAFAHLLFYKKEMSDQFRVRSKKDGTYFWVTVQGSIGKLGPGEEVAYFVFTDITETKKAEANLRASQLFYQEAVRAAKLTTWTYDLKTHEIVMSKDPKADSFQWTKLKRIANVRDSIIDQIEEEDQPAVLKMYEEVNAGHDASSEFWFKPQKGREPRSERIAYLIQKDEKGNPTYAIGLGKNITAERKVEERYERELGYLRDTNDNNLIAKGHYNLTKDLVLEYTTKNDSLFKIKSSATYSEAIQAFAGLPYTWDERKQIADKLDRSNLLKRYQNGQMTDSLMYRRRLKGRSRSGFR